MFVHPEWTRKGVAKMLLDACEKAAREAGFKRVEIGATLSGVPFYERMGYREIEEKGGREMRDLGNGVELEVVRMGRDLC
jgi:GNAT superfamily N-acetyltransferase